MCTQKYICFIGRKHILQPAALGKMLAVMTGGWLTVSGLYKENGYAAY